MICSKCKLETKPEQMAITFGVADLVNAPVCIACRKATQDGILGAISQMTPIETRSNQIQDEMELINDIHRLADQTKEPLIFKTKKHLTVDEMKRLKDELQERIPTHNVILIGPDLDLVNGKIEYDLDLVNGKIEYEND